MPECSKQWMLDVNDRYQKAVGVVTSLSTAALVLPIVFLRNIIGIDNTQSIADVINGLVYFSWSMLGISIFSGIIYYYCSAKWVKLAWGKKADFFGKKTILCNKIDIQYVEKYLDRSYFFMMFGFYTGLSSILLFIITY